MNPSKGPWSVEPIDGDLCGRVMVVGPVVRGNGVTSRVIVSDGMSADDAEYICWLRNAHMENRLSIRSRDVGMATSTTDNDL